MWNIPERYRTPAVSGSRQVLIQWWKSLTSANFDFFINEGGNNTLYVSFAGTHTHTEDVLFRIYMFVYLLIDETFGDRSLAECLDDCLRLRGFNTIDLVYSNVYTISKTER